MAKIITFAGVDCYDTLSYVARVILCTGNSILISNTVKDKYLSESLGFMDMDENEIGEIAGISITSRKLTSEDLNHYDFVLIYLGTELSQKALNGKRQVVVVTNPVKPNWIGLTEFDYSSADNLYLVCKGVLPTSFTKKYVAVCLGVNPKSPNNYGIEFNEYDYKASLNNYGSTRVKFNRINYQHKDAIIGILKQHFEESILLKAYKKASKGGLV